MPGPIASLPPVQPLLSYKTTDSTFQFIKSLGKRLRADFFVTNPKTKPWSGRFLISSQKPFDQSGNGNLVMCYRAFQQNEQIVQGEFQFVIGRWKVNDQSTYIELDESLTQAFSDHIKGSCSPFNSAAFNKYANTNPQSIKMGKVQLGNEQPGELMTNRAPIIAQLSQFFELDELGYIVQVKTGQDIQTIQKQFKKNIEAIGSLFANVARLDAAYAINIRSHLQAMGIASQPMDRLTRQPTGPSVRPGSFVFDSTGSLQSKEPGVVQSKKPGKQHAPTYIDAWALAIFDSYKANRHADRQVDNIISIAQKVDYEDRVSRVRQLHQQGLLCARVVSPDEIDDFVSYRHRMQNDILSTTLWSEQGAAVTVRLFIEYQDQTLGIFLDPTRVNENDFGVSFNTNAGTVGSGFKAHLQRRQSDGAAQPNLEAQRQLLVAYNTHILSGGSGHAVQPVRRADGSGWDLKKSNNSYEYLSRGRGSSYIKENEIPHNEQTLYRGVEGDAFLAFFVKSNSSDFGPVLAKVVQLQNWIRAKRGIFVPIFSVKPGNLLEEVVPDILTVNMLGLLGKVTPVMFRSSLFSQQLSKIGITEDIAAQYSQEMRDCITANLPKLMNIQFLMLNMKDIRDSIGVLMQNVNGQPWQQVSVRIIDNFHLVFPTIHKTKNEQAENPDWYMTDLDLKQIKPSTQIFLTSSIRNNLDKFLGIKVQLDEAQNISVTFDQSVLRLFDPEDTKKTDFAKCVSRAIQCLILYDVFGRKSIDVVRDIVRCLRDVLPHLGWGLCEDMILGSLEMQQILIKKGYQKDCLTRELQDNQLSQEAHYEGLKVPEAPRYSLDAIQTGLCTIEHLKTLLPTETQITGYLLWLGVDPDLGGIQSLGTLRLQLYPADFERQLIRVLLCYMLVNEPKARKIISILRTTFNRLGYSANGQDLFLEKNPRLEWLQAKLRGERVKTEYFGVRKAQASTPQADEGAGELVGTRFHHSRGGRAQTHQAVAERSHMSRGRFDPGVDQRIADAEMQSRTFNEAKVLVRALFPEFLTPNQIAYAKKLGLADQDGRPIWHKDISNGLFGISVEDLLGEHVAQLLTGPAFDKQQLEQNQKTVKVYYDPKIVQVGELNRMLTHTLAVTTEGDNFVLRPNGLRYVGSGYISDGLRDSHNERNQFRFSGERLYMKGVTTGNTPQNAYEQTQLIEVEAYDHQLLSDTERRRKARGIIEAGRITVTAAGGFGSERIPLSETYNNILAINTRGPQFEKNGKGSYVSSNQIFKDSNELDVVDYITKPGDQENRSPVFKGLYPDFKKWGHQEIQQQPSKDRLGSGDFTHRFVELKDGSYLDRGFLLNSIKSYLRHVLKIAFLEIESAYYLKATLFGGGFFANAKAAGDLRPEIVNAMVQGYADLIEAGEVPEGTAIEFPRYGSSADVVAFERLCHVANQKNIYIVWNETGDLCDFSDQKTVDDMVIQLSQWAAAGVVVILNAGDAMSWAGNEKTSASVEAMLGNNSNLRAVFNWHLNPTILDSSCHRLLED